MDIIQKAKYLIENNHHMVIATADLSANPWVSPVFFMYDDNYNFYWVSAKDAKHSKNIRENDQVAIAIVGILPDNHFDGVYIDAKAIELTNTNKIEVAIRILSKRKQPDKFTIKGICDVTGKAAWRIFQAIPNEIFKRADAIDEVSKQAITIRTKINLIEN